MDGTGIVDAEAFRLLEGVEVEVPRGEPRRLVTDAARALSDRKPEVDLRAALGAAAASLVHEGLPPRAENAIRARTSRLDTDGPSGANGALLALGLHATLPALARRPFVSEQLGEAERLLAELAPEDRAKHAPALARVAIPALGIDVELVKDEGYRYVATYPPEGSEGVDVPGRAAAWLTRRMTVDGDAPRLAMRRFLALAAEEVEVDLPIVAGLLEAQLAEQAPEAPQAEAPFLSLALGLVEEAIAERGFPW